MPNSYDVDDILEEIKRKKKREVGAGAQCATKEAHSLGPGETPGAGQYAGT